MVSILVLMIVAGCVLLYLSRKPTVTDDKKRWLRIAGWILLGLAAFEFAYFLYIVS